MDPGREGIAVGGDGLARCWWCVGDPLYESYHDREWGRPVDDDARIFEKLCLEGFQSGLSWLIILRKRESFRSAFRAFDVERLSRFTPSSVDRLMLDAGIVRNRAKIEATINNAKRCRELINEMGSLAAYVWSFEPNPRTRPGRLDWVTLTQLPISPEAKALSKDLKRRRWAFVGPTTVYSAMESIGMVNDHMQGCRFRKDVEMERARFERPRFQGPS
jgi:DNA-3-methyladenine glycosylase I